MNRTVGRWIVVVGTMVLAGGVVMLSQQPPATAQTAKAVDEATVKFYKDECAGCHGTDRRGALGPALIPSRLSALSKEVLFKTIRDGRPGTPMPPFGAKLKDDQIRSMIAYITSPVEAEAMKWTIEDMRKSLKVFNKEEDLEKQYPDPVHGVDINDLMGIVERENRGFVVVDGRRHKIIKRIQAGYKTHVMNFNPVNPRWAYIISRDGWVWKLDLYSLKRVRKIRVGLESRGLAISDNGKYVMAGDYIPNQAVVLDAKTLEPIRVYETFGIDPDGNPVRSRVADVLDTPFKPYFILALKEAGHVWVVDWSKEGLPVVADVPNVGRILHDAFLTEPDGRYFMIASQADNLMAIIDLAKVEAGEHAITTKISAGLKPHPGQGAMWYSEKLGTRLAATPAIGTGLVTIWDTRDWSVVRQLRVSGPGLFISTHHKAKHVWGDVVFGRNWNDIYVIDKETLDVVKTIRACDRSVHPEFTYSGRYVYISCWNGNKVVVYDDRTLKKVKEITGIITPTGISSVGNRLSIPGG